MRTVNIYLLKILLLVGLFIGCDKMLPNWEESLVPLWQERSYKEFSFDDFKELPGPAVLMEVSPTNRSIVQGIYGLVLSFNKKPQNFKTKPPMEFCFADEIKTKLGDTHLQNFRELETFAGIFYPPDASVYLIGSPEILEEDHSTLLIEAYWADVRSQLPTDGSVSLIDIYWGTESPQQHTRLGYILTGPE